MARVAEGFLLGTHYDLTFYLLDGNLYVRMKSSLSRKKVKYSPRFVRTMQSANELGRASKIASRVYRELSKEQKRMVFVLYKKMTGVAKIAFKYGKSEAEAEREVRAYLVKMRVAKKESLAKVEVAVGRKSVRVKRGAALFVLSAAPGRKERRWKRKTSLRAVGGKASFSGCLAPAGPRQKGYPEAGYCRGRPTRERSGVCGGSINPPRKKAESLLNLRFPRCWIDKSGRVC